MPTIGGGVPRTDSAQAASSVTSGSNFAIAFGATNVLGLSHYARREGSREIALLPGFVAEEWERVGKMP